MMGESRRGTATFGRCPAMESTTCPNCSTDLRPVDHYCPNCGQASIGDGSLKGFMEQFLGDYFTFDSKIIRSLMPLLFKPGKLTQEYLLGRRARYIPPLRMFIFLSVIFFLIIGWSGAGTDGHTPVEDLQDHLFWDSFFSSILPKLFFLFLPLFALLLHLFYRDRPATFEKPFIFSAHFHAFVFLAFTIYGAVSRLFASWGLVEVNLFLIMGFLLYTLAYLWTAIRQVMPRPLGRHLLLFTGLLGTYLLVLMLSSLLAVWMLR